MKHKPNRVRKLLHRTIAFSLSLYLGIWTAAYAQNRPDVNPAGNSAATRYRSGDAPFHFDYPSCNPQGGSATCNGCCSAPDAILKDQFRGPGALGDKALNDWYLEDLWPLIQARIQQSGNKIVAGIKNQTTSIGSFLNAQNTVRSAASLQMQNAKTAGSYASSEALCRFATLSQGLAYSDGQMDGVRASLSQASLNRQLLKTGMNAGFDEEKGVSRGQSADKAGRWEQYTKTFCDPGENKMGRKSGEKGVCETNSEDQYNKDVDFVRTIADPLSLDIGQGSKDMQNVNALASNLYAHDVTNNPPVSRNLDPSVEGNSANIREYMMMRSAIAKRAVAENSFASIVAMKAKGSAATADYTKNLLVELGVPEAQASTMAGDNPSYFAQMETLTRKLYQSPAFYVNLMESPDNVARQQAAMKSFELMQQRDLYKSMARSEMLLATLLELYVSRESGGASKRSVQSGAR